MNEYDWTSHLSKSDAVDVIEIKYRGLTEDQVNEHVLSLLNPNPVTQESLEKAGRELDALREELTAQVYADPYSYLARSDEKTGMTVPGITFSAQSGVIDEVSVKAYVENHLLPKAQERKRDKALKDALRNFEEAAQFEEPVSEFGSLADLVDADLPDTIERVQGMWEEDGNVVLSAQYKAGKSALVLNLIKSLVDGVPFLGQHVSPVERHVTVWDAEMNLKHARDRYTALGIDNLGKVHHEPLRGYNVPLTSGTAKEWAVEHLKERQTDVWIIDTFAAMFHGDENSKTDVEEWLGSVAEIKRLAGVREVVIVAHTGHAKEGQKSRARGSSYLPGWSDSNWDFTIAKGDDGTLRELVVTGRGDFLDEPIYCTWDRDTYVYSRVDSPKASDVEVQKILNWFYTRDSATIREVAMDCLGKSPDEFNSVRTSLTRKLNGYVDAGYLSKDTSGKSTEYSFKQFSESV